MAEPDEHRELPDAEHPDDPEQDQRTGKAAAAARMAHQHQWVDQQVRVAMAKGEFDDLPGAGKPIQGLGTEHDPDWWVKKLVERERITGVLPPSLQLRKEDAELDARLADIVSEADVRREVADFNERVIRARYSLDQGPPLVTMPRDVEETVGRWREARVARRAEARTRSQQAAPTPESSRRRWWRRRPTDAE